MQALVYDRYGPPEVLARRDMPIPAPAEDEVRVEVHAAALNSWDWDLLVGSPLIRLFGPLRPPHPILGCDLAGRVVEVGARVQRLQVGDEVFGDNSGGRWGALAEYACAREDMLAIKPREISFAVAAALPQAGVLALQGLRLRGGIESGHRVLIEGAGGGVGTMALQMAKARGAYVACVDRAEKRDRLLALGADQVFDYEREDYTRDRDGFDLVLDVVGRRSLFAHRRALRDGGVYVMAGGTIPRLLQHASLGPVVSLFGSKKLRILVHRPNVADLEELAARVVSGELRPVIDRECALDALPQAFRDLGAGRVLGKVVASLR